jgi:hypothetical protein
VKLSLATLSGGEEASRRIMLHDLHFHYCSDRCKVSGFSSAIPSESAWYTKIIEVLVVKRGTPVDHNGLPRMPAYTALTGSQAGSATADAVVEAFVSLDEDSTLWEYFLKNLVRHICGFEEESLVALARGVLSEYRLLLAVASRQSLSFTASHYCAVVNRMLEWREDNKGSNGSEDALEFGRGFIRDLKSISEIRKFSGCTCLLQM